MHQQKKYTMATFCDNPIRFHAYIFNFLQRTRTRNIFKASNNNSCSRCSKKVRPSFFAAQSQPVKKEGVCVDHIIFVHGGIYQHLFFHARSLRPVSPTRAELAKTNRKKFLSTNMHALYKKTLVCLFVFALPLIAVANLAEETVSQSSKENYNMKSETTNNYSCSTSAKCTRKCCKPGYYIEVGERLCVKQENPKDLRIPVYNQQKVLINDTPGYFSDFITGFMKCHYYVLHPMVNKNDNFYIQEDGKMMLEKDIILGNDEFCVDIVSGKNLSGFVCFPITVPAVKIIRGVTELSTYIMSYTISLAFIYLLMDRLSHYSLKLMTLKTKII